MRLPTTGPHFFVVPQGDKAWLDGDEAHHLARVLRAAPGDPVSLADGSGGVYQTHVADVVGDRVRLHVAQRWNVPAPSPRLTVVHALPKGRKLHDIIQRLSEVGVDAVVPVRSVRTEVRLDAAKAAKLVERLRAVALAAAKQSRRARVMEVHDIADWVDAFAGMRAGAVLWEQATTGLRATLAALDDPDEITLGIGPEGGLAPEEVAATRLPAASLGDTILRTETAALVAATVVLAACGRLP